MVAIFLFSNIVLAQELSPTKIKEINKAISNFESAVTSKSKDAIQECEAEMQKMGQDAIPAMTDLIVNKSKDALVRQETMRVAIKLGDEKVASSLISVAEDKNDEWYNRVAAITYIGKLEDEMNKKNKGVNKKYLKNLEQLFEDSQAKKDIRKESLRVYGKIGQNEALSSLVSKLSDSDDEIRYNAIYGIGLIRTAEGENALIQGFLKDKNRDNPGPYVHLFGFYKIKKASTYLMNALKEVKGKSMDAIATRGTYIDTIGELGDQTAIPVLKEIADNPDVTYNSLSAAEHAAIALAKMGDYETIKKVIKKIEIDGRAGVGNAKSLRGAYKKITGQDFSY